ncbi:hypothetical protein GUITHDRAFT_121304 [Guillardia theta CCMP2712]|uniref:Uncharacterized protein n=1 Tax=Guillardia theta (strain CCMP2712) TaxID=905079 RepID=L1I8U2_GUITC|nr:hypothetical protein GUITHDRAFT_122567 [Guillardia theta CCMP2712]XP_005819497.1 hypothetical protein GUITHDRAFT_121304 [Guillardia theta CCMP2712]EKX31229.1 hypothetical protein GUITHDRAFT_122567 [Guillardia theta CCMP2712]EKX32517.1 hypothetical protein GUITHDRAFT_121304 [Guillardia theta CCMP2712]|eukprot:XP_005818209.1 hypothetical protein GUITHDRAFT_122567 [Guillardia theta CCMP2712]
MTIAKKRSKKNMDIELFDKGGNNDGGKIIIHAIPNLSEAIIQDVSDISKCISCDVVESWLHLVKWRSDCIRDTGCTRHMKPRNIDFVSTYFYPNLELLHTSGAALDTVTATGGYEELLRYWKRMRREGLYDPNGMTGIGVLNQNRRCQCRKKVAAGEGIDNFGQKDIPLMRQGIAKLLREQFKRFGAAQVAVGLGGRYSAKFPSSGGVADGHAEVERLQESGIYQQ